ncbi:serine protease DegS/serine protease DegQ [Pseudofulvimonas gallinarii]|uniref:Serine protease DegS/serine protease DegQ n=1 Tax=Pseudofulvimonas gallinarii TaxID=634155 RepID=A0A4R3L789_9GAMM|nr:serine protease DegS/serine protease DegQ [Pseudofulvimonas gallinarii]
MPDPGATLVLHRPECLFHLNRVLRSVLFLLQFVVVGLAAAFVLTQLFPARGTAPNGAQNSPVAPTGPASYATAVRAATPAVVNIYANSIVTERPLVVPENMRHLFPGAFGLGAPRQRINQSLGSGVIVSPDGHVLTTYHVVAQASDIQVALHDGRVTRAQVIGSDRDTDLAVLKIEGSQLPSAQFAEPGTLQVGDVVLAIGNPFGIGQRVTMGIVSAIGNDHLNLLTYDDFIQTDAAINDGNSGGALVNANGQLVGINTAVFRFGEGIGFAIPAQAARAVLDQILAQGYVTRGWLGLDYRDPPTPTASEDGAQSTAPRGVQVTSVYRDFPGAEAGLAPGDVLLHLDGQALDGQNVLRQLEAALVPGSSARVDGLRAGVPFTVNIEVVQRPSRGN